MAQRVLVSLEDDLDGSEAAETIGFSLDGRSYEIDLNETHAAELREQLAAYVASARRAGAAFPRARRPRRAASANGAAPSAAPAATTEPSPTQVREWARANGYEVSDRGRVPGSVLAAYREAVA